MPSTTPPGRACRPAASAIATTASSGPAPSSRPGPRPLPASSATPSPSTRSEQRTRRWARQPRWASSAMAELSIPTLALVVLIGASGSGKSTFARMHFRSTEVLSSDFCRGLVADDENDQSATTDAFEVLHFVAAKRLAAARLTVVDATSVQPTARKPLLELARRYHAIPVAIVFDLPEKVCQERNRLRPDRDFGPHVVRRQVQDLRRSVRGLPKEGFRHVHVFRSAEEVDAIEA